MSEIKNPLGRELTEQERSLLRRSSSNAASKHGAGGRLKDGSTFTRQPAPINLRLPKEKR